MSYIMVDIEADGPCPGLYSMASFGAVVVRPGLTDTFYSDVLSPLEGAKWIPEALAVSGIEREKMLTEGKDPTAKMLEFELWLRKVSIGSPRFIADNNGFDWMFIAYYFWKCLNRNPLGYSSTNLGSLYKGLVKDCRKNFKKLRKTKHTHHPVDDAKGNAEALLTMQKKFHLAIKLE